MEEILIEEKKYVSSKRAAKITGYAKDYVGQLCREGRVPARLVGRSWYVLESAIQDHRFGKEIESADVATPVSPEPDVSKDVTEPAVQYEQVTFPRYEASHSDTLPPLNRLERVPEIAPADTTSDASYAKKDPLNLTESWNEWFDQVRGSLPVVDTSAQEQEAVDPLSVENEAPAPEAREEVALTSVPLHVVRLVTESFSESTTLSRQQLQQEPEEKKSRFVRKISRKTMWVIRIVGVLVAIIAVAISVVGSGYLDNYMTSYSQAQFIFGVSVYNR